MSANSFAPINNNRFSRRWGASGGDAVDPYVNGYMFVHFAGLPSKLSENITLAGGNHQLSQSEITQALHATCLAVTMPGGTMNRAEFQGLGGVKWAVPTNADYDNTVTLKFLEFSTLPLYAIIHGWFRMIRDYRAGVSNLVGGEGEYTRSNYSATMYYWTTKPDGKLVEYYACLTGLYPLKDPADLYGADLTTYDKLEMDIDFNVDYVWHEDWVRTKCQDLSDQQVHSDLATVEAYRDESGSGQGGGQ